MLRPVKGVNAGWHGYCIEMSVNLTMFGGANVEQYVSGLGSVMQASLLAQPGQDPRDRRDIQAPALGSFGDYGGQGPLRFDVEEQEWYYYQYTTDRVNEAAAEAAAEAAICLCR